MIRRFEAFYYIFYIFSAWFSSVKFYRIKIFYLLKFFIITKIRSGSCVKFIIFFGVIDCARSFFIKFIIKIDNNFYIFLEITDRAFIAYKFIFNFIFNFFRNIY